MATRENLPKIITDIQDIVAQLCNDFETSREPITDDNHALHRLCAKLEFLLTTSLKDKSLLGGRRNYWHWIYACLKNTKGLSDGLKYVQANKDIQSSKGRGRAFIRYCLVHQTLADSLQNCVMNESAMNQHINSESILSNPTFSSAFVTALYDLNAVNFDLNSKGYDLDSGWPTFASKRNNSSVDQWAIQSHVGSLGSLTSASIMMDAPRMHGSGSSGPQSVDQRVEELVLELDQSDQRIKDQQDVIVDLESRAESLAKSTNEKEDILARVISDVESKNRHLHDAMSQMSTEFESREHQWSDKHAQLMREKNTSDTVNANLVAKVEQLEQDKRTLEDLVSQQMSQITSNFSSNSSNSLMTPVATSLVYDAQCSNSDSNELEQMRKENTLLYEKFQDSQKKCMEFEFKLNNYASDSSKVAELNLRLEQEQDKMEILQQKLSTSSLLQTQFIDSIKEALSLDDIDGQDEFGAILQCVRKLREENQATNENYQASEVSTNQESADAESAKDQNELELLIIERDTARLEADKHKHSLNEVRVEVEELKVELKAVQYQLGGRINELEEEKSILNHESENQQRHHEEMLADLKVAQDNLKESEIDLQATKQKYQELKKKMSELNEKCEVMKQEYEDEICENEFVLEELQAEMHHHALLSDTLDHNLEKEKVKSNMLSGDLDLANKVVVTFTENLQQTQSTLIQSEQTMSQLQIEMKRLNEEEELHEKQISLITGQIEGFFECIRLIDENMDVGEFKLEDAINDSDADALQKWRHMQETFLDILKKYKALKSGLATLEAQHSLLSQESMNDKASAKIELDKLHDDLAEAQSCNDIHLITIKDLSDKHKVLQDTKANNLDRIEKLEYELKELNKSLTGSKHVADELRLQVMDGSNKNVDLEKKVEGQDLDIENLKEKITQLLVDKDKLWKDTEELRDQLTHKHDDLDESDWVKDDDVTNCQSCDLPFSLTLRRHHCRVCGKIFCKNCSGKQIDKNNKKTRMCDDCFTKSDLNLSITSSDSALEWATPIQGLPPSREYEEIMPEECNDQVDAEKDESSSIYQNSPSHESVKSEDSIIVPARKEVHLPVFIEHPGITLHWEISSDRNIDFRLCYAPTEADEMQDLFPLRRIESHLEPFIGDLVARQEGVYTLILDNRFSRLTTKQVEYKLHTVMTNND